MFLKDESTCGEFKRESKLVPHSGASMCHLTKENITELGRESELTLQRAGYFGKTA